MFHIPPRQDRWTVAVGHCAKLMFLATDKRRGGERMWVEVTGQRDDGSYDGRLRNEPMVFRDDLAFDAELHFEPRHVIDISGPPQDPS